MAKLSAHDEIGRIEYMDYTLQFNKDGKTLVNHGQGWKLYTGKGHKEFSPVEEYNFFLNKHAKVRKENRAYAEYEFTLHSLVSLKYRAYINMTVMEFYEDFTACKKEIEMRYQYSSHERPNISDDDLQYLCDMFEILVKAETAKRAAKQ